MWADNSVVVLWCHRKENCEAEANYAAKKEIIAQQRFRSNIVSLYIINSLTTYPKRKFRDFKTYYTFSNKCYGAVTFCHPESMCPDTCAVCSDIKNKLDNMKMYHFKQDVSKSNLKVLEWIN